ncbi:Cytochrome b5-like Heme/Steroid binding domain containing protein, putative [Angomonas deanei]|uniref:Cytochrome b5-like Heme/Steroid binding domain containing protein, putative n=1 Tax=Angomonas deanei TaxID=59799 RepID=A0A7G2C2L6_9TRYP|nr:Cytochrome b5-like Heme/Steroid binding domain containing protein, putative [Angomonas deanei]
MSAEPYVVVHYKQKTYHVPRSYVDNEHPGGGKCILDYENNDMTEAFLEESHSEEAELILEGFLAEDGGNAGKKKAKKNAPAKEGVDYFTVGIVAVTVVAVGCILLMKSDS